jgi:HSP20 family protein
MDAYRAGDTFVVELDLPGVAPDSIDLTVERNVLNVHAERKPQRSDDVEALITERTYGVFSRQLFLGDTLDVEKLSADYDAGVLTIKLPVAEQAKPRKVEVSGGSGRKEISG